MFVIVPMEVELDPKENREILVRFIATRELK
jgi:hypothetical protein